MQTKSATKEYERIDMFILTDEIERAIAECELVESRDEIRARHEAICQKLATYRQGWAAIRGHRLNPLDFDGRFPGGEG